MACDQAGRLRSRGARISVEQSMTILSNTEPAEGGDSADCAFPNSTASPLQSLTVRCHFYSAAVY